jgi:O-antigen/teichoic acid export membrane protein
VSVQDAAQLQATIERSTRTGMHVAGLRVVAYALAFLSSVMVTRALGPDGRGRYALPIAVLSVVLALGNLGLEHAQIYLAGRGAPLPALWANSAVVGIAVGLMTWALAGVLIMFSGGIAEAVPTSWLVLTLAQVPILLHVLYWLNLIQLEGRVRAGVAVSTVVAAVQLAVVAVMATQGFLSPYRVLIVIGVMNVLTWCLVLGIGVRAGLTVGRLDTSLVREGLRFGIRAQLGIVFVFLLFRVDQILVQRLLGFDKLGLYTLAVTLAELLWLASSPFAAALLPHQVMAKGDQDIELGYASARISLLMVGVLASIAWITAPFLIELAYGPAFAGAVWPFRLLLPGVAALAIQRPLAGVLLKRGRVALVSSIGAVALVIDVGMNVALLPVLGVVAASISSSVAYCVLASAYVLATRHPTTAAKHRLRPNVVDVVVLGRALRGAIAR